jgi:hypothetical protein
MNGTSVVVSVSTYCAGGNATCVAAWAADDKRLTDNNVAIRLE